jgi:GNAT superfamily N-acetyltransferase
MSGIDVRRVRGDAATRRLFLDARRMIRHGPALAQAPDELSGTPGPVGEAVLRRHLPAPGPWEGFVALADGVPRGRVVACVPELDRETAGQVEPEARQPAAFLGLFECVPDRGVAQALIDAARAWVAATAGLPAVILATVDFSTWYGHRLRISPHATDCPGEPDHPDWYRGLLEANGFEPRHQYLTTVMDDPAAAMQPWERQARRWSQRGYRIRDADLSGRPTADLRVVHQIALSAFARQPAFTPLAWAPFQRLYAPYSRAASDARLRLIEAPDGAVAGFALVHTVEGHAWLKSLAVTPGLQGLGLGAALAWDAYDIMLASGATSVGNCLMLEGNQAHRLERGAGREAARYALFAREA